MGGANQSSISQSDEYMVQPRWTNMLKKQRARRSAQEVEEEGKEEDQSESQAGNRGDVSPSTRRVRRS
ncbi:unnamed protein product [Rhizopus stolonifer]